MVFNVGCYLIVVMHRLSVEQRILVVKTHYSNGESVTATLRRLRATMGRNEAPSVSAIHKIIRKFEASGSVGDKKSPGRARSGRSLLNQEIVFDNVMTSPQKSVRRRSQELNMSVSTVQRILRQDLHLHPYKIQLTQELKPTDHRQRREFVEWLLLRQNADADFHKKIIFSDEAHFHLSGFVNKQNCRIWGLDNPQEMQEQQMHPLRVTVWCGFWSGGVIGPYFFEDDEGNAVTVTGERYRRMITEFLWPQLVNINTQEIWFQQDGATSHTARDTLTMLREQFRGRILSRNGDQNWPPRSCDLTPLDFFLWGHIKARVYENKPQNIPELKEEIWEKLAELDAATCGRVIANFLDRVNACRRSRGAHMPDVVFHT